MPRRSPWHVPLPSPADFAFFVSHVSEDAEAVKQLVAEITACSMKGSRAALSCFFDIYSWPVGTDIGAAVKSNLLRSAFMVAWVTPAYLDSQRGWVWMELAYAELIELSLNHFQFERPFPYILPVFLEVGVERIHRTPLLGYWQRKVVLPEAKPDLAEIASVLVQAHDTELPKRLA